MKKLANILSGLAVLLFISVGCQKAPELDKTLKSKDILNAAYGTHVRNTFDIYLPEGRDKDTPVIILLHGGSWYEGDKSLFTDLARFWRDRGYAAVTMNYRLTNTAENNIHPAQVNDIAKAIEFISSKAEDWQLSASKFALQGASAGAHLALLYTYKYNTNNKVKTVISMAGPTDLSTLQAVSPQHAQGISWLIGSSFQSNPAAYAEASPITYVRANSKPTLIFHGKLDLLVPYQQSLALENRLGEMGVNKKLILIEDTGHEVVNLTNTATFLSNCESWLKLYLK